MSPMDNFYVRICLYSCQIERKMLPEYALLTPESAPQKSADILTRFKKKFGFIPNMQRAMALSPETLTCYLSSFDEFGKTSFSAIEREVVLITTSVENNCTYCVAGHTGLAKRADMPVDVLEALRAGTPLPDPKLNALRDFTQTMVLKRGLVEEADVARFLAAGYNQQQLLEVVLGVAHKTISNYVNQLVKAPLDDPFKPNEWQGSEVAST